MDYIKNQPIVALVVTLIIGILIGLPIGWYTVAFEGGGPQHLADNDRDLYFLSLAELYEREPDADQRIEQALGRWQGAVEQICELATRSPANAGRLNAMAAVLNEGQGCSATNVNASLQDEPEGFPTAGLAALLILLLAGAAIVFFVLANRRGAGAGEDTFRFRPPPATVPEAGRAGRDDHDTTPVARFQTTYTLGNNSYDDSFSIESASGDFLGECGVGISEIIGSDTPRHATAFEIWLFDKNDIRTVTKVIMSDHAFYDEGFKAKLAPKGEPILARPNETIVLETASLIVNAEITDMEYGQGILPEGSYFERLTVELSAWVKEGDYDEPDVQSRIDEMLDY